MSTMLRFKDESEFEEFRKARGLKERTATPRPTLGRTPHAGCLPSVARVVPGTGSQAAGVAPKTSELERRFAQQIRAAGLPEPEVEYYHLAGRDFRLDFAWPHVKVGVEIQGMAHRIKAKFNADIEKRALAMLAGWRVLELNGDSVRQETGIAWLTVLLR